MSAITDNNRVSIIGSEDFKLLRDGLRALGDYLLMDMSLLHASEGDDAAKARLAHRATRAQELSRAMTDVLMTSTEPALDFTEV